MAKQVVTVRVLSMEDAKKRSKALKTAVGLPGVISAELAGDRITVVGEEIDAVALTIMLRKRMGFAEIVSVAAVAAKKDEKKAVAKEDVKSVQAVTLPYQVAFAQPYIYETEESNPDPCSIM